MHARRLAGLLGLPPAGDSFLLSGLAGSLPGRAPRHGRRRSTPQRSSWGRGTPSAPRTSPHRAAVSTRNSNAGGTASGALMKSRGRVWVTYGGALYVFLFGAILCGLLLWLGSDATGRARGKGLVPGDPPNRKRHPGLLVRRPR